ncbi:CpaF family protein [Micrococcoides hystricis]|uniref:CpaF family protein n=1 Tax=Micrococcoides hystricis TaxID=1572761 RepID=A0ABV6P9E4_9MICC
MAQAIAILETEVRDMIRDHSFDPVAEPHRAKELIAHAVDQYDARSRVRSLPALTDPQQACKTLFDLVVGFGPLQPLLDDPDVEEIWINQPDKVFVARSQGTELTGIRLTAEQVTYLVERMLKSSGRRIDYSSPFVDAQLPDGSRLHVVIPDITSQHWAVNIRKFIARARKLTDLVAVGSLSAEAADFLTKAVRAGLNIMVSGATQAGKTTMLNCLSAAVDSRERIITVEEIFELQVPHRDVVAMQCRQANLEGQGEIPLRRLVKEALRMRPERIFVGEVREAESLDLLIALNSGIPGGFSIHANSARDAIAKICTLPMLAGENITANFIVPTVASSIDLVIHCVRDHRGHRHVQEIMAVGNRVEGHVVETSTLFEHRDGQLVANPNGLWHNPKFDSANIEPWDMAASHRNRSTQAVSS